MNRVLFPGVGHLVGLVVYRDLFAHAGVLRFWIGFRCGLGIGLLCRLGSRLISLVLLLRLFVLHLAGVLSRLFLGLLLPRLLGYFIAAYGAYYGRHDNGKENQSYDPEASQNIGAAQPCAPALLWRLRGCREVSFHLRRGRKIGALYPCG